MTLIIGILNNQLEARLYYDEGFEIEKLASDGIAGKYRLPKTFEGFPVNYVMQPYPKAR